MFKAQKPIVSEDNAKLKVFFYGGPGTGKTMTSLEFPRPYFIDTENGAKFMQYKSMLHKKDGVFLETTDYEEIVNVTMDLLSKKHPYKTLIIDSMTGIYSDLVEKTSDKMVRSGKSEPDNRRLYGEVNKKMRRLFTLIQRLDMNVIITSHSKEKYGPNMTYLGETYDCYKKIEYILDLALEVKEIQSKRVATVHKTRIKRFQKGESFPFSYEAIADRYGREILERDCEQQELATSEQVNRLNYLVKALRVSEETTEKWLDKAQSSSFKEMEYRVIQKCIDFLEEKISANHSASDSFDPIEKDPLHQIKEKINNAKGPAELSLIVRNSKELPDNQKKVVRDAYEEKLKELKTAPQEENKQLEGASAC